MTIYSCAETKARGYLKAGLKLVMTVDSYSGQKENVLMKACHQCHSLNLSVTSQCPPDKHQLQKYQQGFPAHHLRHLCPLRPQWTPPPDLSRSLGRTALLMVPQKCCAPLPSGVCACSTLCVAPLFSSTSVLPAPAHPLGLCLVVSSSRMPPSSL